MMERAASPLHPQGEEAPQGNSSNVPEDKEFSWVFDESQETSTLVDGVPQIVDTTNPPPQPHRKCQYPECPEKRLFQTDSAFRKHVDKHTRPYKCPIIGCKAKDFSNAGDLRRHRREVHTSPAFVCPVVACKRHRKGFGRKDNLIQHLQRTHGEDAIWPSLSSDFGTVGKGDEVASPNGARSKASESGESASDDIEMFTSDSSEKAFVIAKLQELEALKKEAIAKFDGDIAAFNKVLSYM